MDLSDALNFKAITAKAFKMHIASMAQTVELSENTLVFIRFRQFAFLPYILWRIFSKILLYQ